MAEELRLRTDTRITKETFSNKSYNVTSNEHLQIVPENSNLKFSTDLIRSSFSRVSWIMRFISARMYSGSCPIRSFQSTP